MNNAEFDAALVASAFSLAAERDWSRVSVAQAARDAGLPLDRARQRFSGRCAVLLRFGSLADQAALSVATDEGSHRDRLFDMLMRRIDFLQRHRAGVLALLRVLPADPATALALAAASLHSMGWMLEGAGISSRGLRGRLRRKGLLAVWLWTLRAWQRDESEDLASTMAALDQALSRAGEAESWLGHRRRGSAEAPDAAGVTEPLPAAAEPPPPEPPASPPV
jgi:ubiquinone biosynthesis protein COQ9